METLPFLTPEDRFKRIQDSKYGYIVKNIYRNFDLNIHHLSEDERNYVLFNINDVKKISRMTFSDFKEAVAAFKYEEK